MIDLAEWDAAQSARLDGLDDTGAEDAVLQQLLQTSFLLELSKIGSAQPELSLFVQTTLELVAQFFPVGGCRLEVRPPGLPAVEASFGDTTGPWVAVALRAHDEELGTLTAFAVPTLFDGSRFFARVAEQVALSVASVVEVERLRRGAADANAARLAATLEDWRDEPWLEELVAAIAALPNAVGAELTLDGPYTGGRISVRGGMPGTTLVDRRQVTLGRVTMALALTWDRAPEVSHSVTLARIWDDLTRAVGRAEERRLLQEQVETDELTGVGNRRRAIRNLAGSLRRADRRGDAVTVLMLDLDKFKAVNDDLGHAAGDAVLRAFSAMLVREAPDGEVARMGGEEFLVILPGVGVLNARAEADRIRLLTPDACADVLPDGRRQTVSIGVSVFPTNAGFPDALVREADRALYEAKRSGRDQVAVAAATGSDHPVRL